MSIAALVTWVVTAGFGFYLLGVWLRNGGTSGSGQATHFKPPLVFGHFLLAAGGLVLWVVYLVVDSTALAWVAFVDLVVVAALGDLLVYRWAGDRRRAGHTVGSMSTSETLAEQRFPTPVVVLHGLFAVATVILVLLSALEVGGS